MMGDDHRFEFRLTQPQLAIEISTEQSSILNAQHLGDSSIRLVGDGVNCSVESRRSAPALAWGSSCCRLLSLIAGASFPRIATFLLPAR